MLFYKTNYILKLFWNAKALALFFWMDQFS